MRSVDFFVKAYQDLSGNDSIPSEEEMTLQILENWSSERLGDRKALTVLCFIILFVEFPNNVTGTQVLLETHTHLKEILGENVTVGDAGFIQTLLDQGRSMEEIKRSLEETQDDPTLPF